MLTDTQQNHDKAQKLTDTGQSDAETLSVVPGKEPGGMAVTAPHTRRSGTAAERTLSTIFASLSFFIKSKILFRFLSVSGNRY